MSTQDTTADSGATPPTIRIRYDETVASYASQFVVNASQEDVIINFSSGYIADPQSGASTLPVHTRIALSVTGASRLVNTLVKALQRLQEEQQAAGTPAPKQ